MTSDDRHSMTALAAGAGDTSYITPGQVLHSLVRHRRFLMLSLFLVIGATTGVLLMLRPLYTATIVLAPEEQTTMVPTQFAGLASLAGLSLGSATEGPQFYAAILTSRPITESVLLKTFPVGVDHPVDSIALIDLIDPRGDTEAERRWNGTLKLGQRLAVAADLRTGMIRLSVTLPSPLTAASVANQFADELNRFNAEVRQSQARARRQFIEARVTEVSANLTTAEEAVRQFLLDNRDFENSPRLTFEHGRLQRVLGTAQELYVDLERQLNTARIEEVDDIPAVTTIEAAVPPYRKSRPRRRLWLILVTAGASLVLAAGVVLKDHGRAVFGLGAEPT